MTAPVEDSTSQLLFWLALRHQEDQQGIADKTAAGLALLWRVLQFWRLDESTPAWLHGVTLQVESSFRLSEQAGFDFVQGSKWVVDPLSEPLVKVPTVFPVEDLQVAMRATGPATVKRKSRMAVTGAVDDSGRLSSVSGVNVPENVLQPLVDDLMAFGKKASTGVGVKFALNGGRGEVQELMTAEAESNPGVAVGWARFTEDSATGPCYFCAMLASKGAVYVDVDSFKESSRKVRDVVVNPRGNNRTSRRAFLGDGIAKVHDNCKCSLRPVFRVEDSFDWRADFFRDQWDSFAGSDLADFRRIYQRPPPYVDAPVDLGAVRRSRDFVAKRLGAGSVQARWWDGVADRLSA